jgi:hypothetical protein
VAQRRIVGSAVVATVALVALASCGRTSDSSSTSTGLDRASRATATTQASTTTTQSTGAGPATPIPTLPAPAPGWSQALTTLPPGGGFTGLSCISDTFCIAVGGGSSGYGAALTDGSGVTASWDGAAWSGPSVYLAAPKGGPISAPILPAVSCTSGPTCVIVDGSDHASIGDGTNWSTPSALATAPRPAPNPLDPGSGHPGSRSAAVSCPTPKLCTAIDNTGQAFTLRNGTWTAPRAFSSPPTPTGTTVSLYQGGRVGISCASASSCTAVVGTSVLDWNGTTWSLESAPWAPSLPSSGTGTTDATAIDCPTTSLCAIVSGTGLAYRNGTRTWSPVETIDPHGDLDGISCPTTSFCMAVDSAGSVVTWNGTSWSAPVPAIPPARIYTGIGTSVACSSARFCLVMNADGDYATYAGT